MKNLLVLLLPHCGISISDLSTISIETVKIYFGLESILLFQTTDMLKIYQWLLHREYTRIPGLDQHHISRLSSGVLNLMFWHPTHQSCEQNGKNEIYQQKNTILQFGMIFISSGPLYCSS